MLRSNFGDVCVVPAYIQPRSAERLIAVMPRRGSTVIDGVDSLPRGGKQRAQIFTLVFLGTNPGLRGVLDRLGY